MSRVRTVSTGRGPRRRSPRASAYADPMAQRPRSTTSSTPRCRESAASSGRARSRWPRPSRTPSRPRSTCSSRPAPAPASRSPTSSRRSRTPSRPGKPAVVATATLALQAQIVDRDMPRRRRRRSRRCSGGGPPTPWSRAGATTCAPTSSRAASPTTRTGCSRSARSTPPAARLGAGGASGCASGRTRRSPATATSSSPACPSGPGGRCRCRAHECLGGKCPLVAECFVERAREAAKDVDVIVTNHSFMAIDSLRGPPDAARARRARRRRGARARRPGDLDDHRRADRRDGHDRGASGPAGSPRTTEAARRGRRSCSQGVARAARRGPDARHPRLGRPRAGPGAGHRAGGADRAQADARARTATAPARWPGRPSTRCTRTPSASSRSASSTSSG